MPEAVRALSGAEDHIKTESTWSEKVSRHRVKAAEGRERAAERPGQYGCLGILCQLTSL